MRFLRRHQYVLCFLAVLVFSCVMVLRQLMANESAHVELREDFIQSNEESHTRLAARLYQVLIQQLPVLSEQSLVNDLERSVMLVNLKQPDTESLVWKYYVSVKNELRKRSERRLANVLAQGGNQ